MKKSCTLCGCSYGGLYTFKAGHICETCVKLMKTCDKVDTCVRTCDQN